ncbi:MAG: RNA polymerase sigma factor [Alphaproteobacteria bacterium]|nr:RNA polymerase sigma factor [Alphaproteobacteria bacterium]MDX5370182.1 RNA polymerase sigma factor [Alphaproteobacteria bacterium]MDX5464744.1 RNA polymerase sigma factor [Alphaproteobacteria bacterium]
METDIRHEIAALTPRLRRFAYALAGSMDEGDDLVQSACVKALSGLDRFRPGTRLDSWMYRIVQTLWIDRARMARRRATAPDPDAIAAASDEGLAARRPDDRLTLARVRQAVQDLPEDQRAVLVLVAIEGLSYREAAETLEIPIGTVMSRLARARARLAPMIGD